MSPHTGPNVRIRKEYLKKLKNTAPRDYPPLPLGGLPLQPVAIPRGEDSSSHRSQPVCVS